MAKCVVTGGAGFIGSHITEQLLAAGHETVIVDNFSTGRIENVEIHKGNPRVSVLKADIAGLDAIKPAFAGAERVFHIAALADIVPSIVDPVAYYRSNVLGTFNVLEAARAAGVKRFVYAASSSCYGIPDAYPTLESAPARPQYPYALTKYLGEQAVMHWSQVYGLPAVSLRL
ncbi:MAG: NAD-dependent epimerase/dehydratase family protein, partial [Elusimicrobia bacterium]|nr:NAD-dependent epimerase/dehydratase family protein [Elusimicrobiota bacterium]